MPAVPVIPAIPMGVPGVPAIWAPRVPIPVTRPGIAPMHGPIMGPSDDTDPARTIDHRPMPIHDPSDEGPSIDGAIDHDMPVSVPTADPIRLGGADFSQGSEEEC